MKSVITEAKLTKRYNTGDYEYEEHTLVAAVDDKESGSVVLVEMKKQINEAFVGAVGVKQEEEEASEEPKAKKGKKSNVKGKPSVTNDEDKSFGDPAEEVAGDEVESVEDDEATDNEDGDASDNSSEDAEGSEEDSGSEDEGDDEEEEAKPVKANAAKVSRKAKPQAYDREVEQHKRIFSSVLRSVAPEWNKTEGSKVLAKKASVAMGGKPFLDADGEVLESFVSEVKKLMGIKKAK